MKPPPRVSEEEEDEEPLGVSRGGGATRRRGEGRATTHISTESSNEVFSWREGGGAVRRLELPTSCIRERGGAMRR
jgi:hypothetical protein